MKDIEEDNLFLELMFDGLTFDNDKWENLIDKWKLNVVTDSITKKCSYYNDDYSICITGESEKIILDEYRKDDPETEKFKLDKPINSVILTICHRIDTRSMLHFLNDIMNAIYETDDINVVVHINDIISVAHPKWLIDRMIKKG